ncbi:MAG: acyl-CoA thioesterase [bacterium]|jgi:acyl-CoA thioester hydrolase
MSMMPTGYCVSTNVDVRYAETDQMGVVYYGNYFTWFEVGRNAFFQSLGRSYRKLEEQGLLLPVVEASCRYQMPARYEDQLTITTELKTVSVSRIKFSYIIRRKETRIATGETTQAFVSKSKGRPVNLKKYFPELWDCLQRLPFDKVAEL